MLLKVDSITKAFPGVQAIKNGSFELRAGEIHALVGENGAGKSTLIKILTGVHQPDAGYVQVDDRKFKLPSPIDAHKAGIVAIYQEFSLIPSLTIAANLFLGRETTQAGLINSSLERARAVEVLKKLGSPLDPNQRVSDLSVSEQQIVEIARALLANARILIMDEPTAALAPREVRQLFDILRDLVKTGMGIIFVCHRLDEVVEIADRVTVMRDGVTIETRGKGEVTRRKLIELMVGRSLEEEFPQGRICPRQRETRSKAPDRGAGARHLIYR